MIGVPCTDGVNMHNTNTVFKDWQESCMCFYSVCCTIMLAFMMAIPVAMIVMGKSVSGQRYSKC